MPRRLCAVGGAGATGSRLVTGTTTEHELLEVELAEFVGADSGLVFSSGYTANLGAVTALSGPGSLIVSDAGSHASLVDACRLSRARVAVAPHSDVGFLADTLRSRVEERALVVTDSVFSADGDLAPLRQMHQVCREYGGRSCWSTRRMASVCAVPVDVDSSTSRAWPVNPTSS